MEAKNLHYSMVIQWELLDEIYVVTVPELPGCRTHGKTYEEAVAQGQDAIDTWVYGENPATLPKPQIYKLDAAIAQNRSVASLATLYSPYSWIFEATEGKEWRKSKI